MNKKVNAEKNVQDTVEKVKAVNEAMASAAVPPAEIPRTPEQIAVEINVIKRQTYATMLYACIEIGKRLAEAKAMVAHGAWGGWLKDNVDFSPRKAQQYMALYSEYSAAPNPDMLGDLSYGKAVALIAVPQSEREEFIEENDVANKSTKEVEKLVKQLEEEKKKNEDKQLEIRELAEKANIANEKAKAAEKKAKAASQLEKELKKAQDSAEDFKKKLEAEKNKEPEKVEVIPADVQEELNRLRELAKKAPNEYVVKIRTIYDDWLGKLNTMVMILGDLEKEDATAADKYRSAIHKACAAMAEQTATKEESKAAEE